MVMRIFTACADICSEKMFRKNHFSVEMYHIFQKKVGSTCVLRGEHMVDVVVSGVDKATISMHCYLAASRSPAIPQNRYFQR